MRPILVLLAMLVAAPARAADPGGPAIPVLVPLTGFLAAEGRSQRNGAVLALTHPPAGLRVRFDVQDTGTSPEVAVNALERAAGQDGVVAVVAPMLGTQMLAMLPVAAENKLPLLTTSGTAAITRQGNPWVFRFFPEDQVAKAAQVRFAVERRGVRRPAVIYQTTAYGQSGHEWIIAALRARGMVPVYEEGLDVAVRDMTPVLAKARAAGADSLLLHLHTGPSALLLRTAAAMGLGLPVVAGSGISQPSGAALLDPGELAGVCAETAASPVSADDPAMAGFLTEYRAAFNGDPDAFAVGQYDGVMMVLDAVRRGAGTPEAVARALATGEYQGLAMRYRSDGTGNMAHSSIIICYDRGTRVPSVAARYDFP